MKSAEVAVTSSNEELQLILPLDTKNEFLEHISIISPPEESRVDVLHACDI